MTKLDFKNRWVLVTGASSGLGWEIARQMAQTEKANLILSSRRIERLDALRDRIVGDYGVEARVIGVDLSHPDGPRELFEKSTQENPVFAVVNNAGLTTYGNVELNQLEKYETILQVNFFAVLKLSLMFIPYFREKGEGAILNVSSGGAFVPLPYQSVYAASKSAQQSFSESLREECRRSGIVICSLAPGGIRTEMYTTSGLDKTIPRNSLFLLDAPVVAKHAIHAFKKRKALAIPGTMNKIISLVLHLTPRSTAIRFLGWVFRPSPREETDSSDSSA